MHQNSNITGYTIKYCPFFHPLCNRRDEIRRVRGIVQQGMEVMTFTITNIIPKTYYEISIGGFHYNELLGTYLAGRFSTFIVIETTLAEGKNKTLVFEEISMVLYLQMLDFS